MSIDQATIGVDVDDFKMSTKNALKRAAALNLRAVELSTVAGEVAPENLTPSGRRHLLRLVDSLGLRLVSLVADIPGLRLTDPRTAEERVERTRRVVELAADLQVPVVTASLGAITHPETGEPSPLAIEALRRIGEYAESRGAKYAIRPSLDAGERLVRVLKEVGCPAIGVGFDPAAMVMRGANPLADIDRFIGQIALVHARDGTVGEAERAGQEARFGEGEVDWVGILETLGTAEYRGAYVIRRTDSANPIDDIEKARDLLARMR